MSRQLVNGIGLVLDIAGAILLWRYGLPAEVDPEGRNYIITSDVDVGEIARGKVYRLMQHLGVGLLVAGFALQFLSNWLQ